MNGFDTVELVPPGMIGRLFGKKPKGNAIRAIQNFPGFGSRAGHSDGHALALR
jgi:hypothetical protein